MENNKKTITENVFIDENSTYEEKAKFYLNQIRNEVNELMLAEGHYRLIDGKITPLHGSCNFRGRPKSKF